MLYRYNAVVFVVPPVVPHLSEYWTVEPGKQAVAFGVPTGYCATQIVKRGIQILYQPGARLAKVNVELNSTKVTIAVPLEKLMGFGGGGVGKFPTIAPRERPTAPVVGDATMLLNAVPDTLATAPPVLDPGVAPLILEMFKFAEGNLRPVILSP
jgi:hypothetical protein